MPDHEFEKQVHQKIGEMKLRPSEAVWEKVEKQLHGKQKRRRLAIWLPLLLLCLGLGGYLLLNSLPGASNKEMPPVVKSQTGEQGKSLEPPLKGQASSTKKENQAVTGKEMTAN